MTPSPNSPTAPPPATPRITLEIAAFDLSSARAAAAAGADRIELCRAASVGGLTPPLGWIRAMAAEHDIPTVAMVRAHADGWTFSDTEHAAMRADARAVLAAGADGVVWGALTSGGVIDTDALHRLIDAVGAAPVIVHRAFDHARDLDAALDALIAAGVTRVLTGGGPGPALGNADRLADLIQRADGAIGILPGGGVRSGNVAEIVNRTGAREVHSGAGSGGSVDPDEVRRLRAALDAHTASP